jgi:hypothetical protein
MEPATIWALVLVLAIVGAIVLAVSIQRRRRIDRGTLRERFGHEYDRLVEEHGSGKQARRELRNRLHRVSRLQIRDLTPEEHQRFSLEWTNIQARFVDDPVDAVRTSDRLIEEVMVLRGYPTEGFDQRIADLSVYHASVVQHYRAATELSRGLDDGQASTEDLRQAMVHHRAIFDDLVRAPETAQPVHHREAYT